MQFSRGGAWGQAGGTWAGRAAQVARARGTGKVPVGGATGRVGGSRTRGAGLGGRSLRDAQGAFREGGDRAKWADPG